MNTTNVSLADDLRAGDCGRGLRVSGGWGVQRRLQSLGIQPGAMVRKVSAMKEYAK